MNLENIVLELNLCISILVSAVLGFIIGLERKIRKKEAGIRTHTILCLGSCLMMVISTNISTEGGFDKARIAAQIVSGIGFLGAGMIIFKRNEVRGLTTAAGIWATAGIGMACGAKLYVVAIITTILLVLVQWLLHTNVGIFKHPKAYSVNIKFKQNDGENWKIKDFFETDRFNQLVIDRSNGEIIYSATMKTEVEYSSTQLYEFLRDNPFIISVERCDED